MISALLLALLLQQPLGTGAGLNYEAIRAERRLKAVRTTEKITIDGVLSEAAWTSAAVARSFIQSEPNEGEAPTEETEVRVLYDKDNLYFGIFAHDSEMSRVIISELKKDFEKQQGDYVDIVLDTFHDARNGYMFGANAAGAKWDAQLGNEGREVNSSWDGIWFVKTSRAAEGWYAEIAIPFKTLKFRDADVQTWGFNIRRNIRRKNEESYWSPLPRIYNLERVSLAGTLEGLEDVHPGANFKFKPYVVSSLGESSSRVWKRNADFGFDAKYGITSGLTWDFTYNTDFSQVEADTQQINLTRFSLFFPEKREFFLENSGVFVFGSNEGRGPIGFNASSLSAGGGPGGAGTTGGGRLNSVSNDMILFFSRNIGLSGAGEAIPLLGGTRLTGRVGRYELGFLNIQQKKFGASRATNFGVARVKRNILASSDIGAMFVNKDEGGPNYNRAYGADANFRLLKNYYLNGYVARTESPLTRNKGKDMARRASGGYKVDFWDVRVSYVTIGENYRDEVGFVPRVGMKNYNGWISFHIRPKRLRRWLREMNLHDSQEYVVDSKGRLDTRYFDHHLRIQFQDGASMEAGENASYERLIQPLRVQREFVPVGAYGFNEWFVSGNTNTSRLVSVNGRLGIGDFYYGQKTNYQAGALFRLNYRFNGQLSYTRNVINLPHLTNSKLSTNLLGLRLNYSFSTIMFLNAFIQYNSDARQVSSNIRFNIIHHPLSDFFLVYNERRDSVSRSLLDRSVIGKFTYMFAR